MRGGPSRLSGGREQRIVSRVAASELVWLDSIETAAAIGLGDYAGLRRANSTS